MVDEFVSNSTARPAEQRTWIFSPLVKPLYLQVSTRWYGFGVSSSIFPVKVRSEASVNTYSTFSGVRAESADTARNSIDAAERSLIRFIILRFIGFQDISACEFNNYCPFH